MNSRLPEQFRDRAKQYAAKAIRLFVVAGFLLSAFSISAFRL
jgi:hypothetical protein